MRAVLTIKKMPKTCDKCPLFVNGLLGITAFCVMDGKYTEEEIKKKEKDGELEMYYHGCLSKRLQNCPLKAESEDK